MTDENLPAVTGSWLPAIHESMAATVAEHARELVCSVEPGLRGIRLLDVAADGSLIAAAADKLLVVWRRGEPVPMRRWLAEGPLTCLAFALHGPQLCSGGEGGRLRLFSPVGGEKRTVLTHPQEILQLSVHSGDSHCVFRDASGDLFRVQLPEGHCDRLPLDLPHDAKISLDESGENLEVSGSEGVAVYRLATGELLQQCLFSDDCSRDDWESGRKLVACRGDTVYLWDRQTGHLLRTLRSPGCSGIVAADAGGEHFATSTGMRFHFFQPAAHRHRKLFDYTPDVHSLKLRGDDLYFVGSNPCVSVVNPRRGSGDSYADSTAPIIDVRISEDGSRMAVADDCSGLSVYNLENGKQVYQKYFRGAGALLSVDLRGEEIVAGSMTGNVYHANIQTGQIRSWALGPGPVQGIALTEDALFCGNYRGRVFRIDLRSSTIKPVDGPHCENIRKLRLRDGKLLVVGECGHIQLLDVHTLETVNSFRHRGRIYPTVFGGEDHIAFTGDVGGAVCRWDLRTGVELRRYLGVDFFVRGLFYRDGRIGAVGLHGEVVVWDENSGERLFRIVVDTDQRCRVLWWDKAFTRVMVTGGDGVFRCYDTATSTEVAQGHHIGGGYLWVALAAEGVSWCWTDQLSRMRVLTRQGDSVRELAAADAERERHLKEIKCQSHTMKAVGLCVPDHIASLAQAPDSITGFCERLLLTAASEDAGMV